MTTGLENLSEITAALMGRNIIIHGEYAPEKMREVTLVALQSAYEQGKKDAVPKWLPIETAPMDGSFILAYWPTMKITNFPETIFSDFCSEHDIWYLARDLDFGPVYPTHWMPLPAAPQQEVNP